MSTMKRAFEFADEAVQAESEARMVEAMKAYIQAATLFEQSLRTLNEDESRRLVRQNARRFRQRAADIREWITRTSQAVEVQTDPMVAALRQNDRLVHSRQKLINQIMRSNEARETKLQRVSAIRLAMVRECDENIELALTRKKLLDAAVKKAAQQQELQRIDRHASLQRVSSRYHIPPGRASERKARIQQRLRRAGAETGPGLAEGSTLAQKIAPYIEALAVLQLNPMATVSAMSELRSERRPATSALTLYGELVVKCLYPNAESISRGSFASILSGDEIDEDGPSKTAGMWQKQLEAENRLEFVTAVNRISATINEPVVLPTTAKGLPVKNQPARVQSLNEIQCAVIYEFVAFLEQCSADRTIHSADDIFQEFFPIFRLYVASAGSTVQSILVGVCSTVDTPNVARMVKGSEELAEFAVGVSIMSECYPVLMRIARDKFMQSDEGIKRFCNCRRATFQLTDVELRSKFVLTDTPYNPSLSPGSCFGYASAVRELESIAGCITVEDKLWCIRRCVACIATAISSALGKADFGADELLPIVTYCVICAANSGWKSEVELLQAMAESTAVARGELQYDLITLCMAVYQVEDMASKMFAEEIKLSMQTTLPDPHSVDPISALQQPLGSTAEAVPGTGSHGSTILEDSRTEGKTSPLGQSVLQETTELPSESQIEQMFRDCDKLVAELPVAAEQNEEEEPSPEQIAALLSDLNVKMADPDSRLRQQNDTEQPDWDHPTQLSEGNVVQTVRGAEHEEASHVGEAIERPNQSTQELREQIQDRIDGVLGVDLALPREGEKTEGGEI